MTDLKPILLPILVLLTFLSNAAYSQQNRTARAVPTVVNGFVVSITVTDGGFGYTTAPKVSIAGETGNGAIAIATVTNGVVNQIIVQNAGQGYAPTASVTISAPPSGKPFSDGLVAYYPFNGNARDETGNGNDGNPGTAQIGVDRFDAPKSAYYFNGVDSFITFPRAPTTKTDNLSFFCWVKPTKLPQWGFAITLGFADPNSTCDGFGIGIGDTTQVSSKLLGENACVTWVDGNYLFQAPNVWHHIGFSRLSGKDYFYVDGRGVAVKEIAAPKPPTQFAIGTLLGSERFNAVFNGAIDDVRIYERALSDTDVTNLYRYERAEPPSLSVEVKQVRVRMSVIQGKRYQLEASVDLVKWVLIGTSFVAADFELFQDIDVLENGRYFRIQEIQP